MLRGPVRRGPRQKDISMTFANTPADRAMRRSAMFGVLAAAVVVGVTLCAPALAQDTLASSAVVVTPVTPDAPLPNFSLLGLFLSADWIVKIVMLGLLGAS